MRRPSISAVNFLLTVYYTRASTAAAAWRERPLYNALASQTLRPNDKRGTLPASRVELSVACGSAYSSLSIFSKSSWSPPTSSKIQRALRLQRNIRRDRFPIMVGVESSAGRDQLADDHVLLQAVQRIHLALDRRARQHLDRMLEARRRQGSSRCSAPPW